MNSVIKENTEELKNIEKSFFLNKNIYQILIEQFEYNSDTFAKTQKNFTAISKFLVNKFIITDYQPPTIYKVTSISFDRTPLNTTIKINGVNYLLSKYYEKFHLISIKNKNQPILICDQFNLKQHTNTKDNKIFIKNKKREVHFLPCEFCYLINEANYLELLQNNISEAEKEYDDEDNYFIYEYDDINIFNLIGKVIDINQVENNIIDVVAKEDIDGNTICFNKNKHKLYQSTLLKNKWIVIYPKSLVGKAKKLQNNIIGTAKRFGINVEAPTELTFIDYINGSNKENGNILFSLKKFFIENSPLLYNLVLVIADSNSKELYAELKKECLEEIGIISQFILVEKMNTSNVNYYNSILLQMISKTGSELFRIDIENELKGINNISVCGLYFINEKNNEITLSLTSSYNEYYNKYHMNSITVTNDIQNIRNGIDVLFADSITNYKILNGSAPEVFLIYLNNEKKFSNSSLTISIILSELKFYFDNNSNKYSYAIISPILSSNCKEGIYIFSIIKPKSKPLYYFVYENRTEIAYSQFKSITLKLTYYYWNNYNLIPTPCCLKYAEISLKMLKKYNIEINKVKPRLLNEPFYL